MPQNLDPRRLFLSCRFSENGFPPGRIDLLKRALCGSRKLTLQIVVEAFGQVIAVRIGGVFDGQVGRIVAQFGPEVLHLCREALLFLVREQLDDGKFEHKRSNRQPVADPPELGHADGIDQAAVPHVVEMNVEIGFQAFLIAARLVEVSIGLGFVRKTARHHVDVKIDAEIFRIAALEPQRRALRLDGVFLGQRLLMVIVNVFERSPAVLSPEDT